MPNQPRHTFTLHLDCSALSVGPSIKFCQADLLYGPENIIIIVLYLFLSVCPCGDQVGWLTVGSVN